jgi:hypothetical protein
MPASVDRRSDVSVPPYPAVVEGLHSHTIKALVQGTLYLLPSILLEGDMSRFVVHSSILLLM